jgi:tRNA pseudouridine32 synthase/23S rRNA pseudouridine746 synthase
MMHIGHPIMGDKLYHPEPARFELPRMALHATSLSFVHPLTHQAIDLKSDVPF